MEYQKLHPNSKKSWFISRAIFLIILGGAIVALKLLLLKNELYLINVWFGIAGDIFLGLILVLLILNTFVYPIFEYKQWKYIITKDKIEFSEGIFFVKKVTIPIVRVQHIQVSQGPINRKLGLSNIMISTAGGAHKIPNVETCKAEEISEFLKNKIREKVEENV